MEATDFDRFTLLFQKYKKMAGVTGEAPDHLLECLSSEIMAILFNTYSSIINDYTKQQLNTNIVGVLRIGMIGLIEEQPLSTRVNLDCANETESLCWGCSSPR